MNEWSSKKERVFLYLWLGKRQRTKTHDGRNKRTSNSDLKAGTQGRGALGEPRRSQAWIYSGFGRVLTGKLAGAERESSNIDTKRGGFFGADNVVFSMKQKRKERNSGQDGIVRIVRIAAMGFLQFVDESFVCQSPVE